MCLSRLRFVAFPSHRALQPMLWGRCFGSRAMTVMTDRGVTPELVRDLVDRAQKGRMLPSEQPLLELVQVQAFQAYRRKWPNRAPVIELVLRGVKASTAAQGICDESTAR